MPYAKFDVELLVDERIAAIPEKYRAAAIALWWASILYSAERLKDGHVTRTVLRDLAHEVGQKRPQKVIGSLTEARLFEITKTGFLISDWQRFHSSRAEVERQRTRDAERKRQSRGGQIQMDVQTGHPNGIRGGQTRDSRAHARASTATASDSLTPPTPSLTDKDRRSAEAFIRNGGYHLTDLSLGLELDQRHIPEQERHGLLDLAADLRRDHAA